MSCVGMAAKQAEEYGRDWAHSWTWSQSRLRIVSHVDLSILINTGKLKTFRLVATAVLAVAVILAMAVAAIAVARLVAAAPGTAVVVVVLVSIALVVILGVLVLVVVVVLFIRRVLVVTVSKIIKH